MNKSSRMSTAARSAVAAVAAAGLAVSGCGATPTPGSASSGELVVYTSRSEALIKPAVASFNAVYPNVTVRILTGGNGELAAKILEERGNPRGDVLINTDTLTMESLAEQAAFEANASSAVMGVPAAYRAPDGNWVALTLRPRVIMYNTNLVKPEELPKSVLDLTQPKWKGQVGSANSTNGALMAQLAVMRDRLGEAATTAFVKGLVDNGAKFFGSHTDVRKAVGAGELKLGLVNHYYYHLSKAEGAPVGVVYPDQAEGELGLTLNTTNAGIIKGAKNRALAAQFVDFLLAPDGQKVFAESNYEYPIVKGVPLADGVPPLDVFRVSGVTLKTMWTALEPTKALAQQAGLP